MQNILFEDVIGAGATWSHVLKRGTALRITDIEGGANVGALFYNWENPTERYNMPDTLKAQHIARLTRGYVLYSDMGRILCSITDDTVGWHDPLSGCCNAALVRGQVRRGALPGASQRVSSERATTASSIELAKYGLERARPGRARQLLQQGRSSTMPATCSSSPATRSPARSSSCAPR